MAQVVFDLAGDDIPLQGLSRNVIKAHSAQGVDLSKYGEVSRVKDRRPPGAGGVLDPVQIGAVGHGNSQQLNDDAHGDECNDELAR